MLLEGGVESKYCLSSKPYESHWNITNHQCDEYCMVGASLLPAVPQPSEKKLQVFNGAIKFCMVVFFLERSAWLLFRLHRESNLSTGKTINL